MMDEYPDRYRIVIDIIRGTSAAKALKLMSSGLQCAAPTQERAGEIMDQYLDAAEHVLEGVDKDVCMGIIVIVDTVDMTANRIKVLSGQHVRKDK